MAFRLALVTGATSGIGEAMCLLLANKGIDLILSGRNQEKLQLLQKNLEGRVSVQPIQADLALANERSRLIEVIHHRTPDLIINNAGFGLYGEALTYPTKEQTDILEVDGRAVLELTLEAARTLASYDKQGLIMNVSSAAGFQVLPMMAVYAATKAFVNNLSQALDFEFQRYGIRVLAICPGMVMTNFQKRAGSKNKHQAWAMLPTYVAEQMWRQIERCQPIKIIDWKYRLLMFLTHFFPKKWVATGAAHLLAKRINPRTLSKIYQ